MLSNSNECYVLPPEILTPQYNIPLVPTHGLQTSTRGEKQKQLLKTQQYVHRI